MADMLPDGLLPEDPITLTLLLVSFLFLLAVMILLFMRFFRGREERISFEEWRDLGKGYVREDKKGRRDVEGVEEAGEGKSGKIESGKEDVGGVNGSADEGDEELPTPKRDNEITRDELAKREKKLLERDTKIKGGKKQELERKEKEIERKHLGGLVKKEQDKIEEERGKQLEKLAQLKKERARLLRLMDAAEKKYESNEVREKNFRIIMSDYQKQLIEVDVEIARCSESVKKVN